MSELALFLIRIAFVAVLWIFILSLLSVIRADIYGRRVISKIAKQNAPRLLQGSQSAELAIDEGESSEPTHVAMLTGKTAGSKIALDKRELVIGRAPNCDLPLSDEFASNMHAKLVKVGDDWVLQDLNSTNGTFVDGKRVSTPLVIKPNTTIRIGATNFELRV